MFVDSLGFPWCSEIPSSDSSTKPRLLANVMCRWLFWVGCVPSPTVDIVSISTPAAGFQFASLFQKVELDSCTSDRVSFDRKDTLPSGAARSTVFLSFSKMKNEYKWNQNKWLWLFSCSTYTMTQSFVLRLDLHVVDLQLFVTARVFDQHLPRLLQRFVSYWVQVLTQFQILYFFTKRSLKWLNVSEQTSSYDRAMLPATTVHIPIRTKNSIRVVLKKKRKLRRSSRRLDTDSLRCCLAHER